MAVLRRWGRYVGMFIASVWVVWCLATAAWAQTVLTWDDLQPPATTLQNPYGQLSMEQTYDLATLARLRLWVAENPVSSDSLERQEILRLDNKLQAQGLEVETLLSHVDQAQAYWQQQSQLTNPQWLGKTIQLSGYVLPLSWSQAEPVTDFLLVPYVGACVHVPSPPPNQIVYVRSAQAVSVPGVFTPVVVEGQLRSQPATYHVFQVDGSRPVDVSYALTLSHLTRSETPPSPTLAPAQVPSDRPWWQHLQARSSALLTQAVEAVHRQRSPGTFLWGLLIAFSYGVLHTLGPGHGKTVIITYFVGQGGSLRRGLTMGLQIAVFHVMSAIGVVVLTTLVLRQSAPDNYRLVQLVSYGAIAAIGGWMLWQAFPWRHVPHLQAAAGSDGSDINGVNASGVNAILYPSLSQQVVAIANTPLTDVPGCRCLTCVEPKRARDWLSLAIGSVPCSGALLILFYGSANNLLGPSIVMVLAISVGMAITLAWIGVLALMGRNYAERQMDHRLGAQGYGRWQRWLKFAGACCVLLLGLGLFSATLMSGRFDLIDLIYLG